jgi:hypothetical protein
MRQSFRVIVEVVPSGEGYVTQAQVLREDGSSDEIYPETAIKSLFDLPVVLKSNVAGLEGF